MVSAVVKWDGDPDKAAKALRKLEREFGDEFYRELDPVVDALKIDARESAVKRLPRRGGLGARVASARLTTKRRRGFGPGLTVQAEGMAQLPQMDAGSVRHPVYGRGAWVTQEITPGWFTDPMFQGRGEITDALDELLDEAAAWAARQVN